MKDADVIIVGAGIVGAACAREISRTGFSVLVLDEEMVGGGATAAGMGHIVVLDDSPAQFALTRFGQRLWKEISGDLPDDCEYDPCGTLWLAEKPDQMEQLEEKARRYRDGGVSCQVVDGVQLREMEPNLRPGLAGGLKVEEDVVVYAPCAAAYFLQQAQDHGAIFMPGTRVVQQRGEEVMTSGGQTLACRWSINAGGSLSGRVLKDIPVRPKRGHLLITDRYPGYIRHQLAELGYWKSAHSDAAESVAFNLQPRKTGQILIGSSREPDRSARPVRAEMMSRMLERAFQFAPGLGGLSCIRSWTGVRAATPDNLPLIGPHPQSPNLLLATGHEGFGITAALATARLLAAFLQEEETEIPLEPYLPSRLAGRREEGVTADSS